MNREEQLRIIKKAVNPRVIRSIIADMSVYHRTWVSEQGNAAVRHAAELFEQYGLESHVYEYPSVKGTHVGCNPFPLCWYAKGGWCEIVGEDGRHIADFDADTISILDESVSMDHRNEPVEIICMDRGSEEEKYSDIDFSGKLIFINSREGHYFDTSVYTDWACGKRGAIGMILSSVSDVEDVRGYWNQYDTIAWYAAPKGCVGFGISPREGDHLKRLFAEKTSKGEKVLARFYTDTTFEGVETMCNAEGVIRGDNIDEEIILYAHACHPRPSANDNLSGTSAVLEAMRMLNDLIGRGILPRPKRTIRGIVGPEMYGSNAELSRDRTGMPKPVAAFNMDMVGAQQGHIGVGPVQLVETPRAFGTIANDVAGFVYREITKDTTSFYDEWICTHNLTETSYSGGSDQEVFNDPETGMPCAYMCQWPDRFYHSSSDDITTVDPSLIAYSAGISAGYAYVLATLNVEDVLPLMAVGTKKLVARMTGFKVHQDETLFLQSMRHLRDNAVSNVLDYPNWFSGEEKKAVQEIAQQQSMNIKRIAGDVASVIRGKAEDLDSVSIDGSEWGDKYRLVAERNYIGRPIFLDEIAEQTEGGTEALEKFRADYQPKTQSCCGMSFFFTPSNVMLGEGLFRTLLDRQVPEEKIDEAMEALYQFYLMLEKIGVVTLHPIGE